MKYLRKIFLITILIIAVLISTSFATTGTVNVQAARVRKEANTTSDIVTVVYENDEVEILEESGDWYKIKYKNDTGYIKKDFIKQSSSVANNTTNTVSNKITTQENNESSTELVVTSSAVNIKLLPSLISTTLTKVETEKELTKIAEINNWVKVTDGTITGWIPKSKLQNQNVSSETTDSQNASAQNTTTQNTTTQNTTTQNTTVQNTTSNVNNTVQNTNTSQSSTNTTSSEKTTNKVGVVKVETAKIREKASTNSNVVDFLDYGDKVTITAEEGDWYKITFGNISGYVSKTLLTVSDDKNISSRSLTEERGYEDKATVSEETNTGTAVVEYAKQYLGYSYVVGGKTPESGFDCSGFTRYVFLNFGVTLASTAADQNSIGTEISRSELQPGDLILFYNEGKTKIGHTGIYIGNGDFIHAANPQRGVVTDNLNTNSYYNERFVTARRIVN